MAKKIPWTPEQDRFVDRFYDKLMVPGGSTEKARESIREEERGRSAQQDQKNRDDRSERMRDAMKADTMRGSNSNLPSKEEILAIRKIGLEPQV